MMAGKKKGREDEGKVKVEVTLFEAHCPAATGAERALRDGHLS